MQSYNPDYYQRDRRVGNRCAINGKDAYDTFNADLAEITLIPGTITTDFSEKPGKSGFNLLNGAIQAKGIMSTFYVGGPSEEETNINISNLLSDCQNCVITTDESRFEYVSVMNAYTDEKSGVDFYHAVTITFTSICRLPLVEAEFYSSGQVYNEGNSESGMKLEITPSTDIPTIEVAGITVKNLSANQTFIIDGIEGRVTSNGINRFADTDLTEFPKIQPGMNDITASAQVRIRVLFYPVFL